MPEWLDELIERIGDEHDEKEMLRAIFALQADTYRRIERMADDIQVQIDAAIAADADAIKAIGVRVDVSTKILTDKLAELSAAAPHIDVTHTIAALNDLKGLADSISQAPAPVPPGPVASGGASGAVGSGGAAVGGGAGVTASLDPATQKPLYTKNDPQDRTNGVWPVASVEGPGGQVLYTFNLDTGTMATGDGADGGMWHAYTGPVVAPAGAAPVGGALGVGAPPTGGTPA